MTKLSAVYARSLFELAVEGGIDKIIMENARAVLNITGENPELVKLLSAPVLSKEEKLSVIDGVFKDAFNPVLVNFIKVMTERKNADCLKDSLTEYERLYNEHHGIEKAVATTAVPMSDEMYSRLKDKLEKITGKQILLTNRVDESCLGGVVLQLEGRQIDNSVAGKLAELNKMLKR